MRPRLLLAIDDSENSQKAVEYVRDVICWCEGIEVTIFHVLETPPVYLEHGGAEDPEEERRLGEKLERARKKWEREAQVQIEKDLFSRAKQILSRCETLHSENKIRTKVVTDAHPDVALAIMHEVSSGGYDTVVMGRRGSSKLKELLFGSVTSKVVHHVKDCAVCIVE